MKLFIYLRYRKTFQFWLSCLGRVAFLFRKYFKFVGFLYALNVHDNVYSCSESILSFLAFCMLWTYLIKFIPETRRTHWTRYLCFTQQINDIYRFVSAYEKWTQRISHYECYVGNCCKIKDKWDCRLEGLEECDSLAE